MCGCKKTASSIQSVVLKVKIRVFCSLDSERIPIDVTNENNAPSILSVAFLRVMKLFSYDQSQEKSFKSRH